MIIKILKAELKDRRADNHFLDIKIWSNHSIFKRLTPRKIRNQVANFYGEPVEVPSANKNVRLSVEQRSDSSKVTPVLSFSSSL
jgi:RNase P/RNase MRP subunit POP5